MKITELRCSACNGTLKVDEEDPNIAICEYCGSKYVIEREADDNVHLKTSADWYAPREPNPMPAKKTGWEPYGWKRGVALVVAGLAIVVAMYGKRIHERWLLNRAEKAAADWSAEAVVEVETETEAEAEPLSGMFAAMVEQALGKTADMVTAEELAGFRWLELENTADMIRIGYSMDSPYENGDAGLTWIELPRDGQQERLSQLRRFSGLKRLSIPNYLQTEDLAGLELEGIFCYGKSPQEVAGLIDNPGTLKELGITAGVESLEGLQQFENLDRLTLYGSDLKDLAELVYLKNLTSLTLENCDDITDFSVLSVMTWLESVSVDSEGLKDIGFVKQMPGLKSLSLIYANILNLNALAGNTTLTSLTVQKCGEMKDCSALSGLTGLEYLDLEVPYGCGQPDLSGLSGIKELKLNGMESVACLAGMPELEALKLSRCRIDSESVFAGLKNLKKLTCSAVSGDLPGWKFVRSIPSLEYLDLRGVSTYEDISGLFSMPALSTLLLNGMECEIDFSKLTPNPALKTLEMDGMKLYKNVKVSGGGGIVYVDYDTVTLEEHTDFLTFYPGLEHLSLADNKLTQINFASSLPALKTLDISENYVTDLRPLEALPGLQSVTCTGNPIENYRVLREEVAILK